MSKQISLLSSPVINHLSIEDGALMAFNPFLPCLSVLLREKKTRNNARHTFKINIDGHYLVYIFLLFSVSIDKPDKLPPKKSVKTEQVIPKVETWRFQDILVSLQTT